MSDQFETLQKLLDGELGSEILEQDPVLAKLAERIYGDEFLEKMGLSRGDSKRALSDTLSDDLQDDMLIEIIPTEEILPFDAPTQFEIPSKSESSSKKLQYFSIGLLLMSILNLFGIFSFLGGNCSGGGCPSDGHTKINLASVGNLDTGWGWSPNILEGTIGIPDMMILAISSALLIYWFIKR
tara:strand:- start:4722 stop:5270 length:549 start_codon:yes stop_codon:yes gene_type:complete